MYIPRINAVSDRERLIQFLRDNSFATLVGMVEGSLWATHLPFVIEERSGDLRLIAHLARPNKQWKGFAEDHEVLVIFQGPHAYISPTHYEKREEVPTWNYAAVHVYGTPKIIDLASIREVMEKTVEFYEPTYHAQWEELDEKYRTGLMQGVVAFEILVTRLEGTFKMSQNKSEIEQHRIITSLGNSDRSEKRGVAEMMKELQNKNPHQQL